MELEPDLTVGVTFHTDTKKGGSSGWGEIMTLTIPLTNGNISSTERVLETSVNFMVGHRLLDLA